MGAGRTNFVPLFFFFTKNSKPISYLSPYLSPTFDPIKLPLDEITTQGFVDAINQGIYFLIYLKRVANASSL